MGKQQHRSPNKLLCKPQRDHYAGLSCGCYCWWLQPDLVSQATCAGTAETSSLLELQYFPYCQPGNTGKPEPKGKKKRWDTGTGRDARKHLHEDRCNPLCSPPKRLLGSQGDDSRNSVKTFCKAHVSFSPAAQDMQKILNKCYPMFR